MTGWEVYVGWAAVAGAALVSVVTVLAGGLVAYGWLWRRRQARLRRVRASRELAAVQRLSSRPHGRRVVALAVERERRERGVAGG